MSTKCLRNEAKWSEIARATLAKHFSQKLIPSRYHHGWRGLSPFKDCVKIAALGTAGDKKMKKVLNEVSENYHKGIKLPGIAVWTNGLSLFVWCFHSILVRLERDLRKIINLLYKNPRVRVKLFFLRLSKTFFALHLSFFLIEYLHIYSHQFGMETKPDVS